MSNTKNTGKSNDDEDVIGITFLYDNVEIVPGFDRNFSLVKKTKQEGERKAGTYSLPVEITLDGNPMVLILDGCTVTLDEDGAVVEAEMKPIPLAQDEDGRFWIVLDGETLKPPPSDPSEELDNRRESDPIPIKVFKDGSWGFEFQ